MSVPFRERNPVPIGAISIAVLIAADARRLQGRRPAADRRRRHLPRRRSPRPAGSRPTTRSASPASAWARSTRSSSTATRSRSTFKVKTASKFGTETGAAIKVKTLLGAMFLALEPKGSGQLKEGATIPVSRTRRRTTSWRRSPAWPTAPSDIDTDQLATSLDTLADLTKDTPAAFQGTLRGLSGSRETVASRNDQISALLQNLHKVSRHARRPRRGHRLADEGQRRAAAGAGRPPGGRPRCWSPPASFSPSSPCWSKQTRADLKPALSNLQGVVEPAAEEPVQPRREPAADGAVLPGLRQHARQRPVVRHLISNLPPRPAEGGWLMKSVSSDQPCRRGRRRRGAGRRRPAGLLARRGDQDHHRRLPAHRVALRGLRRQDPRRRRRQGRHRRRPSGTKVRVKMHYDAKYDVPADAKAALISPSIVGDRFVQLTPAYTGRRGMPTTPRSGIDRTATPLELDEIFGSLNDLNIALGPDGANKADASGGRADPAARLDRPQLRRPGRAVQQDAEEPRRAHQDPGRQQGRAVRHPVRRSRSFTNTLAKNDTTVRGSTTRSPAAPTCWRGSARTSPPCCSNLCIGDDEVRELREGEPRVADQQHLRAEPDLQDLRQASRRARRDPAVRAGGAEQPRSSPATPARARWTPATTSASYRPS